MGNRISDIVGVTAYFALPAPNSALAILSSSTTLENRSVGRLLIVIAALLWSSSGFFAKLPLFDSWPESSRGLQLAFWRALFAGLLILPAVRRPCWRRAMVPMSLAFASMNVLYLTAMSLTTAANAIWLQSTAPWWVFLVSVYWLHETVRPRDLIPLVFGMSGLAVILWNELQGAAQWGSICGLASAFGYAAVVLFLRVLRDVNSAWLVAVNHLVTAVLLLPFVVWHDVWPTPYQLMVLAAFGFFQMALPYLLFSWGLKSVTGQEATAIGLLEPVLLPFWAYLTRAEVPAWWTIAGAAIILAGLILRYGFVRGPSEEIPLPLGEAATNER